jgi:hypothetical protein
MSNGIKDLSKKFSTEELRRGYQKPSTPRPAPAPAPKRPVNTKKGGGK